MHTIFDLAIFTSYRQYHLIPEDLRDGISYVLNVIVEQAKRFKAKHSCTPVQVIDSVDLIAKSSGDLFLTRIDRGKYLVNLGVLRMVIYQ